MNQRKILQNRDKICPHLMGTKDMERPFKRSAQREKIWAGSCGQFISTGGSVEEISSVPFSLCRQSSSIQTI